MDQSNPSATKIMILRHAEKPPTTPPPHGVDANGQHDKESLTARGWQRAGALVSLFAPSRGPLQDPHLATPRFIFASNAIKGSDSDSMRPQETVMPLAQKLRDAVSTNFDFCKGEEEPMAAAALACEGIVLICWEHKNIHAIVHHILKHQQDKPPVPKEWPDDRFDLIFVFDLDLGTNEYRFNLVFQLLLDGDTSNLEG
jgi:hypothetical protein